jgi:hypothetical protein
MIHKSQAAAMQVKIKKKSIEMLDTEICEQEKIN